MSQMLSSALKITVQTFTAKPLGKEAAPRPSRHPRRATPHRTHADLPDFTDNCQHSPLQGRGESPSSLMSHYRKLLGWHLEVALRIDGKVDGKQWKEGWLWSQGRAQGSGGKWSLQKSEAMRTQQLA